METKTTVLFVDDEPVVLEALGRLFRDSNYKIILANSGLEALYYLEQEPIQLVISDFRMPKMNGAELLHIVSDRWPETIRIILSGYADVTSVITAINEGHIYKFVSKPWDNVELREIVESGVEKYWQRSEMRALADAALAQNEELISHHLKDFEQLSRRHCSLESRAESFDAYKLAFSSANLPLLIFREKKCIDANLAARSLLGLENSEVVMKSDNEVIRNLARILSKLVLNGLPQTSIVEVPISSGKCLEAQLYACASEDQSINVVAQILNS